MDLLTAKPSPGRRAHHASLKRWTRELLGLDDDATLTVNELRCAEPECPDIETVIGISISAGHWHRLRVRKPAAEITRADLAALV